MQAARWTKDVFAFFAQSQRSLRLKAFEVACDSMTTQPTLAKDPVCGMAVDTAKAKATAEHAGQKYYFCCAGCAQKFDSNPEQYLKPKPTLVTIGRTATTKPKAVELVLGGMHSTQKPAPAYVCPMCPEIREAKPGACPGCGMALEP